MKEPTSVLIYTAAGTQPETVRTRVNESLVWRGTTIFPGGNKTHVITLADIMRDLEPLNKGRDAADRITYNSLWVHAKRHYNVVWTSADFRAWMTQEWRKALGAWVSIGI